MRALRSIERRVKDFSISRVYNRYVDPFTDKKTDEELVVMVLEKIEYFSVLIERYREKLERYVRRRARLTDEDTQDILQDIFIKTYMNLRGFDVRLSFSSWIYRIAHNHVVSWYRKHHVRTKDRIGDIEEEVLHNIAQEYNIEEEQWLGQMKETFREALEKLPDNYREIVVLRFFEEKDYGEMSDILQIPPGTVAIRLNRAKKKLHDILIKYR